MNKLNQKNQNSLTFINTLSVVILSACLIAMFIVQCSWKNKNNTEIFPDKQEETISNASIQKPTSVTETPPPQNVTSTKPIEISTPKESEEDIALRTRLLAEIKPLSQHAYYKELITKVDSSETQFLHPDILALYANAKIISTISQPDRKNVLLALQTKIQESTQHYHYLESDHPDSSFFYIRKISNMITEEVKLIQ